MDDNYRNELKIALNLNKYIESKEIWDLQLESIDRIIGLYFKQNNRNLKKDQQVVDFLFEYLHFNNSTGSILFSHLRQCYLCDNVIEKLHEEYQEIFDFNFINSCLFDCSYKYVRMKKRLRIFAFFSILLFLILSVFLFNKNTEKDRLISKYSHLNKQLETSLKDNISKMRDIEKDLNKTKILLDNEISANKKLKKNVISLKEKLDYEIIAADITIKSKNQSSNYNENNQKQTNETLNENSQNNEIINLNDDVKLQQNTTHPYFKPKKQKIVQYDTIPKASFCIIHIIVEILIIQDNIFINRNSIFLLVQLLLFHVCQSILVFCDGTTSMYIKSFMYVIFIRLFPVLLRSSPTKLNLYFSFIAASIKYFISFPTQHIYNFHILIAFISHILYLIYFDLSKQYNELFLQFFSYIFMIIVGKNYAYFSICFASLLFLSFEILRRACNNIFYIFIFLSIIIHFIYFYAENYYFSFFIIVMISSLIITFVYLSDYSNDNDNIFFLSILLFYIQCILKSYSMIIFLLIFMLLSIGNIIILILNIHNLDEILAKIYIIFSLLMFCDKKIIIELI